MILGSSALIAVLLGIVEGLTEFIPVSSTGHLIIVGKWLGFTGSFASTFDIAIQLGAILAVVCLYRRYFISVCHPKNWTKSTLRIAVAILPVLILGAGTHKFIKAHLFTPTTVAIGLAVGSLAMIGVDLWSRRQPDRGISIDHMSIRHAIIIGMCQCAALWPGVSRSGATVVGGLLAGLSIQTSAQFSFIIAVPVMMAATGLDIISAFHGLSTPELVLIALGFGTAFLVAWASIQLFLNLLGRFRLIPFAAYRLVVAVIVFLTR